MEKLQPKKQHELDMYCENCHTEFNHVEQVFERTGDACCPNCGSFNIADIQFED